MDGFVFEPNLFIPQASTGSVVRCGIEGEFLYPDPWPQCNANISCGEPLPIPENDPRLTPTAAPGSRTWIVGSEGDDWYKAEVGYRCTDGSKFDTTGNGDGDTVQLETSCKWRKSWEPWGDPTPVPSAESSLLPPCIITHCISPPPIPAASFIEEVTSAWTAVNTSKQYRCQGMLGDGTHTRFWETDRTKSTFSIPCTPDGTFNFVDAPESWPICLEDIVCLEDPPQVLSHPDYGVITGGAPGQPRILRDIGLDDGQAYAQSLVYPQRYVCNFSFWVKILFDSAKLM